VAVVGSRNASRQGVLNAERMAQTLSEAGVTIVSGLALGIDAAAHLGGLAARQHRGRAGHRHRPHLSGRNGALARRIAEEGCIVSECPLGTPPARQLPAPQPHHQRVGARRAGGGGGGQVRLADHRAGGGQGRDVYAVPGSIHATLSKGCHQLIREGARLVESGATCWKSCRWADAGRRRAWRRTTASSTAS
jgi:DNA processing protein